MPCRPIFWLAPSTRRDRCESCNNPLSRVESVGDGVVESAVGCDQVFRVLKGATTAPLHSKCIREREKGRCRIFPLVMPV